MRRLVLVLLGPRGDICDVHWSTGKLQYAGVDVVVGTSPLRYSKLTFLT